MNKIISISVSQDCFLTTIFRTFLLLLFLKFQLSTENERTLCVKVCVCVVVALLSASYFLSMTHFNTFIYVARVAISASTHQSIYFPITDK